MGRRMIKLLRFWLGVLIGLTPGLIGALDNRAGDRLYATLFQLLIMIAIPVAIYTLVKTLGMRANRPLPGLFVGLAAGACFVIDSLSVSLLVTIVDAVPNANRWLPEIHTLHAPILYGNAAIEALIFIIMAIPVGMGAGLLLSLGFGLDLAPLVRRDMPPVAICEDKLRFPALRPYIERSERAIVTFSLRKRREILFGFVVLFGLLIGIEMGATAARGHGFLIPHHGGLEVGMFEGIIAFLYAPAVAVCIWCINGLGNRLRATLVTFVELATFRERVQPRTSAMGSFLAALLTGYVLAVACFAGLYALVYITDKSNAFIGQNTHAAPSEQRIQIGDLTMLSVSTLAGGSGSPLQPSSTLARALFLAQTIINYAWTGGILLTVASRALDAGNKQPVVVVTPMEAPVSSTSSVVHIHTVILRPPNKVVEVTPTPASTKRAVRLPRSRHRRWQSTIVLAAAIAHLLRGLKR